MKRHDVYLTALAQRNRLRREAEETNVEQKRRIELERGFSTYINGANTRAKSATGPRTLSRVGTASSSKSPEPRMKAMSAVGTSRNRKSWAENMLEKENGPFFNQRESSEEDGIVYSQSFDDEEKAPIDSMSSTPEIQESSSLESVEERMQTPSSSREFVVPQLSARTARSGRRGWNLNSSIPFAKLQVSSTAFSDASKSSLDTVSTSSSPSPELGNSISTGDALRAKSDKRRNILEESWNLIDDFERKNKGRSSLIFSTSFSEEACSSVLDLEEEPCSDVIPVSPSGQILELIIHSTWGDQNYVGLNGLELWNTKGEIIKISSISSKDFKENKLDPRSKLRNIVNGNYNTSDDIHTWMAELAKRKSKITLEFERVQSIAMVRVWNYNRNRVHAKRGVKHLEMRLDQKVIFSNEIVCGQGDKSTPAVEPIIFTTEEDVFNRIAQNDPVFPK